MSKKNEQLRLKLGCIRREARCAKGYKSAELAERAGITIRFLSAIESGQRAPGYENLWELIHCLGISADQIFYPDLENDTDAQQVMRLYENCDEREKLLVKALLNAIYSSK